MMTENDLFGGVTLGEEIDIKEEVSPSNESADKKAESKNDNTESNANIAIVSDTDAEFLEVDETTTNNSVDTEDKQNQSTSSSENDSNSSSSPDYKPIADFSKMLFDEGVLTQFDEEEFKTNVEETGDPLKAMASLVQKTIENVHEKWISEYPEVIQDILKSVHAGLPLDKVLEVKKSQVLYDSITEDSLIGDENLTLRKQILEDHYKATTKFSEERIKKEIEKIISLGEDELEAKDAIKELKKISKENENKIKVERELQKKEEEKRIVENKENLKKNIYGTKSIIPGIELTKQEQDNLYKSITTPSHTENGQSFTDVDYAFHKYPLEMTKALHYYYQKGLLKVDEKTGTWNPDFTKLKNAIRTEIVKEQKDAANSGRSFKSGSPQVRFEENQNKGKSQLSNSLESFMKNRK